MTRETRQPDLPEIEPELPELPRLRELSQIELPSADVTRAVFGRIQTTLSASMPVARRGLPVPTWALALGMVIVVPSAFAATSVGATLVRQTVDWVNRAFALVDTTTAEREEIRNAPSLPAARPTTDGVPAVGSAQAVPVHSSAESAPAAAPVVAFDDIQTSPTRQTTQARPSSVQTPVRDTGTLNAERQLLERARVYLRAGDARRALQFTSQHATSFPSGILVAERESIINQAHALDVGAP